MRLSVACRILQKREKLVGADQYAAAGRDTAKAGHRAETACQARWEIRLADIKLKLVITGEAYQGL